jgi:HPt (histidine-containing phosphotransfer) domain-containing protein
MTVKECYEQIGGDYNGILSRFRSEQRVLKFALMFLKDDSYDALCTAMENEDCDEAFRAAHTLKGVCQNLSFDALFEPSSAACECLRNKDFEGGKAYMPAIKEQYERTVAGVQQLQAQA